MFFELLAYSVILMSRSRLLTCGMMFIAGLATAGRNMVAYVYMCEFLTEKWQVICCTIYCISDASTILILTIYFDFISNKSFWILSIGGIFTLLSFILSFVISESPLWLLKVGRVDEAKSALEKMDKFNG